MAVRSVQNLSLSELERDLRSMRERALTGEKLSQKTIQENQGPQKSFTELLAEGIADVNNSIQAADKASMDLVSGKSTNIHATMLAVSRAEIGFNLLVQLRNRALEAYQEVMKMQV